MKLYLALYKCKISILAKRMYNITLFIKIASITILKLSLLPKYKIVSPY